MKNWWVIPNLGDIRTTKLGERPKLSSDTIPVFGPYNSEEQAIGNFAWAMNRYCRDKNVKEIWKRVK